MTTLIRAGLLATAAGRDPGSARPAPDHPGRDHLVQGYTLNRQRFEDNARELEAALQLVRKAAAAPALDARSGQGLVEIRSHYSRPE